MNCLNKSLVVAEVGARARTGAGAGAKIKVGPGVGLEDRAGPRKGEILLRKKF